MSDKCMLGHLLKFSTMDEKELISFVARQCILIVTKIFREWFIFTSFGLRFSESHLVIQIWKLKKL